MNSPRHDGKWKFKTSRNDRKCFVEYMVVSLTGKDIEIFSSVDDTIVLKGQYNSTKIRTPTNDLCHTELQRVM